MRQRVFVESEWLKSLLNNEILHVPKDVNTTDLFQKFNELQNFSDQDFDEIKSIEKETNHDIKAVEYFIKRKLQSMGCSPKVNEYVHFLCTSEDINNLSYALMLK